MSSPSIQGPTGLSLARLAIAQHFEKRLRKLADEVKFDSLPKVARMQVWLKSEYERMLEGLSHFDDDGLYESFLDVKCDEEFEEAMKNC